MTNLQDRGELHCAVICAAGERTPMIKSYMQIQICLGVSFLFPPAHLTVGTCDMHPLLMLVLKVFYIDCFQHLPYKIPVNFPGMENILFNKISSLLQTLACSIVQSYATIFEEII